MDKLMHMAEEAMEGQQGRPQQSGGYDQGPQGYGGNQAPQGYPDQGGMDWSQLGKLVSGFQGAQQQSGGNPSFQHFQNEMVNQGHAQDPSQVNGGVMNQLMSHFSQQTGNQFSGSNMEYDMIAKMVSEKLGIPVPPGILQKLMSWKQAGNF